MAITNAEVVFGVQEELYNAGLIGLDEDGMYEQLLTVTEWNKRGYMIKKGEIAIAKFSILLPKKKEEDENLQSSSAVKGYFPKKSAFFVKRQVRPMTEDEKKRMAERWNKKGR